MKIKNVVIGIGMTTLAAALITGCGGKSRSYNDVDATIEGIVADGYIQNLRICYDANLNKVNDDGETCTFSTVGDDGIARYSLPRIPDIPLVGEVIPGLTIDLDNPDRFIDDPDTAADDNNRFTLQAPPESTFLSPLTTVLQQRSESNPSTPLADLESEILSDLGIPSDSGFNLSSDFVALSNSSDSSLASVATTARNVSRVVTNVLATNLNTARNTAGTATTNAESRAVFDVIVNEINTALQNIAARTAELLGAGNTIEDIVVQIDDDGDFDSAFASDPDALSDAIDDQIQANIDNGNAPGEGAPDPIGDDDDGNTSGASGGSGV